MNVGSGWGESSACAGLCTSGDITCGLNGYIPQALNPLARFELVTAMSYALENRPGHEALSTLFSRLSTT